VYIQSIVDQQTVYLLSNNQSRVSSVEVTFQLRDRTGDFDGNGALLKVQKPINKSGTTDWKTIHGEEFGVDGVTTNLKKDQRYRLIVQNDDGDTRVLGTYVSDANETVVLTVGTVEGDFVSGVDGYKYNATWDNETGTPRVKFQYNDPNSSTSAITIEIYERGNKSNVLFTKQTFDNGPYGNLSVSEFVDKGEYDTEWVVEVTVERNGETHKIREIVGPRNPLLLEMPDYLKVFISIGSIWLVAGLFSRLNGKFGGLVVAGMGAMFYFVGLVPGYLGGGVVALTMLTAGVLFIRGARGGGL